MNSRKIATIAALAALSTATNYAMVSLYNVKFMDLFAFVAGFCFGPVVGALTGILSWSVYGPINPFGFSLPIWFATMLSESIYGIGGAFVGKSLGQHSDLGKDGANLSLFFGVLGVFLTFAYDLVTNIVFGSLNNWSVLYAVVVGFVPFGLLHVLSNALFFGVGCRPAIAAVMKAVGGDCYGLSEK
jgi:uncharacterized membrane protein